MHPLDIEIDFQRLIEQAPAIAYVAALDTAGVTLYVSPQVEAILGYTPQECRTDPDIWRNRLHPDDRSRVLGQMVRCCENGEPFTSEYRTLDKADQTVWFRNDAAIVKDPAGSRSFLYGVMVDITERKLAQQELERSEKRFRQLMERLREERKQVESTLWEREARLQEQSSRLQEVNAALKTLLRAREMDKEEIEAAILDNVKKSLLPIIQRLKSSNMDKQRLDLLNLLESRLQEITSPFVRNLSNKYLNLTPSELQIARLIREGKGTKEIAETLHLGLTTVLTHRQNIRCKLGLKSSKVNLHSFLSTLDK